MAHEFSIPTDTRPDSFWLAGVIALFFGGLLLWGSLAELDAGAIATGEVIPVGKVRTVQHLDGGIIREILVKEGDTISEGALLMQLDETEARSAARAAEKEIAGLQSRLMDTRRELAQWEQRASALRKLAENTAEEGRINRQLYEQQFISKPRLLQLESQQAQALAIVSENAAEADRARQKIVEIETQIETARERLNVARERLSRARVVAPQAGMVQGLRFTTLGGVIPPGGQLLELVPAAEKLVVEARIAPDDIDVVYPDLPARVRLTAYKARSHISLSGRVTQVSGSTFRDELSQGHPFYKARIEIPAEELVKIEQGMLTPGMLAEVEIVAGRRTALRYLFDPVLDSMRRAFKEQ